MKKLITFLFVGLSIAFNTLLVDNALATVVMNVPNLKEILSVKQVVSKHLDWREYYGEVVAISPCSLHLNVDGRVYVFPISKETVFYCNGYRSSWEALRPVDERAYFEAQVYINTIGTLCLASGVYHGEEGIIDSYRADHGELRLVLCLPEQNRLIECLVSKSAHLPVDPSWLKTERAVYVLYNYKQEIRAVFAGN